MMKALNADEHEAEQHWRVPGVAGVTNLDGQLAPSQQLRKAAPQSAPTSRHRSSSRARPRKPVYKPDFAAEEEEARQRAQVLSAS